ncbi:hypothetical protein NHX12_026421 [Muraenolepis orangiensis]|uniref:Uncharacterized protein n=1 Tax=Muraenolepis orangiensis TaxID=630683 RepID=A0A9Q0EK72_9TELE|nr:hypothetical protein NHX12_026421 [Muraenolepis orangiensis]
MAYNTRSVWAPNKRIYCHGRRQGCGKTLWEEEVLGGPRLSGVSHPPVGCRLTKAGSPGWSFSCNVRPLDVLDPKAPQEAQLLLCEAREGSLKTPPDGDTGPRTGIPSLEGPALAPSP